MIIIVDDEDRENEGRPGVRAEKVTPGNHQFHGPPRARLDLFAVNGRALR